MTKNLEAIANSEQTHLEKTASIANLFADESITGVQADEAAIEMGIAPSDVREVYEAGLQKEAADETETPLTKIASCADMVHANQFESEDDLHKFAEDNGIVVSDVAAMYGMVYGSTDGSDASAEELSKTAAWNEAEEFLTAETTTYLQKVASVAVLYNEGTLTSDEAIQTAQNLDLDIKDINSFV